MMIYVIAGLVLSVGLNIFLGWYIRESVDRLMYVSRNIGHLSDITENFKDHIIQIGDLELFYGDQTIVDLINHTKFLSEEIDKFTDIYSLSDDDDEEIEDGDEKEEEIEEEQ